MNGALAAGMLLAVPGLPLLLAAGLLPRRIRPIARRFAPWAVLPGLLAVLLLPAGTVVEIPGLLLGARFGLDPVGRVFLGFTAILWLLAGLYGDHYLASDPRRPTFFGFYLLAMAGNLGLTVALDPIGFIGFFALMSVAAYGLVVHTGDPDAKRAGRVYIALVMVGEVLTFAALLWLVEAPPGTVPPAVVMTLVLLGFGIKVGALPLHVWLPLAHPAAPVPASAVLSGAMIKAGLLGWLRFLPLGQVALPEWGVVVVAAGLAAAFYGVVMGLPQRNPKTVLAYSSISQMGLITIPVGLGLALPDLWPTLLTAVLIYAVHHAFAKGALFLGVGAAAHGRGRRTTVTLGLLLPALSLAGLPFTSGAVAKTALKGALGAAALPWVDGLIPLMSLAAVGTTLLMARFLVTVWTVEPGHHQASPGLWRPWAVLIVLVFAAPWFWPVALPAARASLAAGKLLATLWPVLVGALLGAAAFTWARRRRRRFPVIPAGDLLVVVGWAWPPIRRWMSGARWRRAWQTLSRWPLRGAPDVLDVVERGERELGRWATAGTLLLLLTLLLFLLF
jgi:hydrogenase-4 component B